MQELIGYIVGMALLHRGTTRRLIQDPHRLRHGAAACLLIGVLYTVSVLAGYLHGFGAVMKPWLPIPARDYYLWETIFTIPAFFVILATAGAVTQLVARALGGTGTFEDTFCVLSLGILLPTFLLTWVPETLVLVFLPRLRAEQLGGFSFMPDWLNIARQVAVPVWAFVGWVHAMPDVHKFGTLSAVFAVVVGLAPAVIIALVFIR